MFLFFSNIAKVLILAFWIKRNMNEIARGQTHRMCPSLDARSQKDLSDRKKTVNYLIFIFSLDTFFSWGSFYFIIKKTITISLQLNTDAEKLVSLIPHMHKQCVESTLQRVDYKGIFSAMTYFRIVKYKRGLFPLLIRPYLQDLQLSPMPWQCIDSVYAAASSSLPFQGLLHYYNRILCFYMSSCWQ